MHADAIHTPCPGCGADTAGARHCGACGQRQPAPGDFSLRRLAGEAWQDVSEVDSRLWRSVGGLFRPGFLTLAWLSYRWQSVYPPVRLYLVCSGIYFFLAWDVYFQASANLGSLPTEGLPPPLQALFSDPATPDTLGDLTALMKFLFVVLMGFWVALLHLGNRQPVGAHMVWALHYTCFDFALFSLAAPLVAFAPRDWAPIASPLVTLAGAVALWAWAAVAVHRVYRRGWPSSLLRGLAVVGMDLVLSVLAGQFAMVLLILRAWAQTG